MVVLRIFLQIQLIRRIPGNKNAERKDEKRLKQWPNNCKLMMKVEGKAAVPLVSFFFLIFQSRKQEQGSMDLDECKLQIHVYVLNR